MTSKGISPHLCYFVFDRYKKIKSNLFRPNFIAPFESRGVIFLYRESIKGNQTLIHTYMIYYLLLFVKLYVTL